MRTCPLSNNTKQHYHHDSVKQYQKYSIANMSILLSNNTKIHYGCLAYQLLKAKFKLPYMSLIKQYQTKCKVTYMPFIKQCQKQYKHYMHVPCRTKEVQYQLHVIYQTTQTTYKTTYNIQSHVIRMIDLTNAKCHSSNKIKYSRTNILQIKHCWTNKNSAYVFLIKHYIIYISLHVHHHTMPNTIQHP